MILLSIDIGSTYTKGAMFRLNGEKLEYLDRAVCPTTIADLKIGFDWIKKKLDPKKTAEQIFFTSSAKGGLAISAIGVVPDLTLMAAKSAALSAGGKVVSVHAYKLTGEHLAELLKKKPDIILLAGGTDGGNESYLLHNAELLCHLPSMVNCDKLPTIVFAGNVALKDVICHRLSEAGFDVHPAPNLLPKIDQMEPEGAREKIRNVFLRTIVFGKGLDAIQNEIGSEPMPTPLAVLLLVEAIHNELPDFGDFMLLDMGGATTDVYSAGGKLDAEARVIMRGLAEPIIKRTVEGDLGMRVSASTAVDSIGDTLSEIMDENQRSSFSAFIGKLESVPEYLPIDPEEIHFDRCLASACIHHAMQRHAGTWRRVFTAEGEAFVQQGKDLRQISKIVGSGGFLSAMSDFVPIVIENNRPSEIISLNPRNYTYLRDYNYILPLLGAVASSYPKQAARCAIENLLLVEQGGTPNSL
ncbi:MAG: glutamate mutase L [Holophagaceae bacterium]|nr:glutamate mutase L [Holophagaceae bacterium]